MSPTSLPTFACRCGSVVPTIQVWRVIDPAGYQSHFCSRECADRGGRSPIETSEVSCPHCNRPKHEYVCWEALGMKNEHRTQATGLGTLTIEALGRAYLGGQEGVLREIGIALGMAPEGVNVVVPSIRTIVEWVGQRTANPRNATLDEATIEACARVVEGLRWPEGELDAGRELLNSGFATAAQSIRFLGGECEPETRVRLLQSILETPPKDAYPCCEAVKSIYAEPDDQTTLLGGLCPFHGVTRHYPKARK